NIFFGVSRPVIPGRAQREPGIHNPGAADDRWRCGVWIPDLPLRLCSDGAKRRSECGNPK
ncbi:MAG: hypothetical protein AB7F37_12585, partial [Variibacter sp.]